MKHHLRTAFLFVFLFIAAGCLKAVIPSDDLFCNAAHTGVMPAARAYRYYRNNNIIRFFLSVNQVSFCPAKVPADLRIFKEQGRNNYDNVKVELSQ